jgi:membrane-bound serine protease (ClpP class)
MFFGRLLKGNRAQTRRTARIVFALCVIALAFALPPAGRLFAGGEPAPTPAQAEAKPLIYHLRLDRQVDGIMVIYVRRGLEEAKEAGAGLVVLELDTFGGSVAAAVELSKLLNASTVPTLAWIHIKGTSAGAMITYACDDIAVAPGGTFGDAIVIGVSPSGEVVVLGEKYVRFVAQQMRSNAEANGHDADLAEAMTDVAKEIRYDDYARKMAARGIRLGIPEQYRTSEPASGGPPSRFVGGIAGQPPWEDFTKEFIVKKDEILNLTSREALFLRVAVGRATIIDAAQAAGDAAPEVEAITDIEKFAALRGARIVTLEPSWSEALSAFLTSPLVSVLLLLGAIIGIATELKVPGFGAPGIVGLVCIALLFVGHMGAGAARWTDLILVVVGLVLLAIELFLIPGFGFVGMAGIIMILAGFFKMLVENPPEGLPPLPGQLKLAAAILGIAIIGSGVAIVLLYRFILPRTPIFGALVLSTEQKHAAGFHASEGSRLAEPEKLIGRVGVARSMLRPAGRAIFDGEPYDVVTRGDFIKPGAEVEIVEVKSNRIMVRQTRPPEGPPKEDT